jgi:hypothetical protein
MSLTKQPFAGSVPKRASTMPLARPQWMQDHRDAMLGIFPTPDKQPGRTVGPRRGYGPSPAKPKANKLVDADGNPRIAPLDRQARGDRYRDRPYPHARHYTPRQMRRMTHKANHAQAPFGPKENRS